MLTCAGKTGKVGRFSVRWNELGCKVKVRIGDGVH